MDKSITTRIRRHVIVDVSRLIVYFSNFYNQRHEVKKWLWKWRNDQAGGIHQHVRKQGVSDVRKPRSR